MVYGHPAGLPGHAAIGRAFQLSRHGATWSNRDMQRSLLALFLVTSLGGCFAKTTTVASSQIVSPTLHGDDGALAQNEHDCNAGGAGSIGGLAAVALVALRPRRKRV